MNQIDVDIEQTTQEISTDIETQTGVYWGNIAGNIDNQTDLMSLLNTNYLKTSGGTMTGVIKWDGQGGINGTLNGVQFYRVSADGNLVLLASLTISFFSPNGSDMSLGASNAKWKTLYTKKVSFDSGEAIEWTVGTNHTYKFVGLQLPSSIAVSYDNSVIYYMGSTAIYPAGFDKTLGTVNNHWNKTYTKKICNGIYEASVPMQNGTIVVATPPEDDGVYVLKCTVQGGVKTYEWVEE